MEFTVGQELRFKSVISLNLWVDSIYPAGQLGYKEPHIRLKINSFSFDVPFSVARELFEDNSIPLPTQIEPEVKPVDVEPKIILKKKRVVKKKKADKNA